MSDSEKSRIAQMILSYLLKHPEAQDTLEGIAQWWILEQQINCSITDVEDALEWLSSSGWVQKTEVPHATVRYRLCRDKLTEITSYLRSNISI